MNKIKDKISFNSPVILGFTAVCLFSLILGLITDGETNRLFFSVYRSSLFNPLTYLRLFTHVCGHASFEHFMGNITLILVIGPLLEEKYGSKNMLFVILSTALVTGLANFILFPNIALLGASGIVFALILLASFTGMQDSKIPLTFILVAVIYFGEQIYQGIFVNDNISNFTHILGGVCGAVLGNVMNKQKMSRY
ncbi:MAG: rhomboid family intramembrane serine protease [Lachnospiraceae bacterium]|nr:rhomboid family intramembrane serine protease [Lachnospiraceae bacterium]